MSKQTNNGGPAFPITSSTGDPRDGIYARDGMSLLDYFAAHAPGPPLEFVQQCAKDGVPVVDTFAAWRYAYAKAMIDQRSAQMGNEI